MSDVRRFFLSADVAEACAAAGLTIRTSSAVRQAVYDGRLQPDLRTARNVSGWTEEALNRDILRLVRAQHAQRRAFDEGRAKGRQDVADGVQGDLFGKDGGA